MSQPTTAVALLPYYGKSSTPFYSLQIGLSHTYPIGLSHTYPIGLSHTAFEAVEKRDAGVCVCIPRRCGKVMKAFLKKKLF